MSKRKKKKPRRKSQPRAPSNPQAKRAALYKKMSQRLHAVERDDSNGVGERVLDEGQLDELLQDDPNCAKELLNVIADRVDEEIKARNREEYKRLLESAMTINKRAAELFGDDDEERADIIFNRIVYPEKKEREQAKKAIREGRMVPDPTSDERIAAMNIGWIWEQDDTARKTEEIKQTLIDRGFKKTDNDDGSATFLGEPQDITFDTHKGLIDRLKARPDDDAAYVSRDDYELAIGRGPQVAGRLVQKLKDSLEKASSADEIAGIQETSEMVVDVHEEKWGPSPELQRYLSKHILPASLERTPSPLDKEALRRAELNKLIEERRPALEARVKAMAEQPEQLEGANDLYAFSELVSNREGFRNLVTANARRIADILKGAAKRLDLLNHEEHQREIDLIVEGAEMLAIEVSNYSATLPDTVNDGFLDLNESIKRNNVRMHENMDTFQLWERTIDNAHRMSKDLMEKTVKDLSSDLAHLCADVSQGMGGGHLAKSWKNGARVSNSDEFVSYIEGFLDNIPGVHAKGRKIVEDYLTLLKKLRKTYYKRFPAPVQKSFDYTLKVYLMSLECLLQRPTQESRGDKNQRTRMWHCFHNARIFDFPADTALMIFDETFRYVYKDVVGADKPKLSDQEEAKFSYMANQVPQHPNFPFDQMYFGFGEGLEISDGEGGLLAGLMISKDGHCALVFGGRETAEGDKHTAVDLIHEPKGQWERTARIFPWVVFNLIELINDFNTFVLTEHRSQPFKQGYKKITKRGPRHQKAMPDPYYRMKLKRTIVREHVLASFKKIPHIYVPPDHRWDTRGHYRLKVQRGKMPLPEEIRGDLVKRKYKIFTVNPIDGKTFKELMKRPKIKPKQPDEWMAVKMKWVNNYINGPQGAPYVPCIREVPE